MHLYYGWKLANTFTLSYCVSWSHFIPDHVMICWHAYGGLSFVHHNGIHDTTAEWCNKVSYDVAIEPPSAAFRIEKCPCNCKSTGWGSCWYSCKAGCFTWMYLAIATYTHLTIPSIFQCHEQEKRSRRRTGSMVIAFEWLRKPLLPHSFCDNWGMVRRLLFSIDLLTAVP